MTRDDIIRMATEVGIIFPHHTVVGSEDNLLEDFAHLVAAAEREACANVAENGMLGITIAKAIRARGKNVNT